MVRTKHKICSIEKLIKIAKKKLEDLSYNFSIVHLLFLGGSGFSMSLQVILEINGKKGREDACKVEGID